MGRWRDATHPVLKSPCRCLSVFVGNSQHCGAGGAWRSGGEGAYLSITTAGVCKAMAGWKKKHRKSICCRLRRGRVNGVGEWGRRLAVELLESRGERAGVLSLGGLKWLGNNHQRSLPARCGSGQLYFNFYSPEIYISLSLLSPSIIQGSKSCKMPGHCCRGTGFSRDLSRAGVDTPSL